MKVITLHQPWASFMVSNPPVKSFETRSWKTNYRGELWIHASKKGTRDGRLVFDKIMRAFPDRISAVASSFDELPFGAIVGSVTVVNCHHAQPIGDNLFLSDLLEWTCGDFSAGRFAWGCMRPYQFDTPIPAKGYQGIWNYEPVES